MRQEKCGKNCEELQKEISELKMRLGGYATSNKNYKTKLEAVNAELDMLKKSNDGLQMQIKSIKSETENKIREYNAVIGSKDNEIDNLKTLNSRNESRISSMECNLSHAISDRDSYKKKLDDFLSLPWYKRLFVKQ